MAIPVTFVVAVNDRRVLRKNLLSSPCLNGAHGHELFIQEEFSSAAKAYNDGICKATNDIIIFIHQDMFLPDEWLAQVEKNIKMLDQEDPRWGVVGCWGASEQGGRAGYIYSRGLGILGSHFDHPKRIQTLDEVVLIIRKRSGLYFDEGLPHFHFYGTDICLRAASQGRNSYAISAFCVHNTKQILRLPGEFYECYRYIKRVWSDSLPIHTTCIRISRMNTDVYFRRLEDAIRQVVGDHRAAAGRVDEPSSLPEIGNQVRS